MSSTEEKPSVLSNRVFKVRDWNRLEAYRLDTKIQALETEKKCTHTRISFEQRELKKDLLKLREAKHNRKLSLAERRLGFALKRSSSDFAVRLERCQQAFTSPSCVSPRRCRADSEPPDVFSLPPVTGDPRFSVSTPPSWTERKFNAAHCSAHRAVVEDLKTGKTWSSNPTLTQADHVERPAESSLSNGSTEEETDGAQTTKCPSISTKNPSFLSRTRPKPLLRRRYSTNSMSLTHSAAGKEVKYGELASFTKTDRLPHTGARLSPGSSHGEPQYGCKLTAVRAAAAPRTRQRSYTIPGLSTDAPSQTNQKLEPFHSDAGLGRSTAESLPK